MKAVSVVSNTTVSVERDTEVCVEVLVPEDWVPCSAPCSGLTIAIAKISETITETAIRDAKTSSSLSCRFKRNLFPARGRTVSLQLCIASRFAHELFFKR